MKHAFLFISCFLSVTILLVSCTSGEHPAKFEIITVHTFRLSEETQEHLHQMYPTVVDNPAAPVLAFSNYATSPTGIVITDYEGNFIEKIGKEGRGPGELRSARYFGFDADGNMVVLDKVNALFNRYERTAGEFTSYDYPIKQGISVTSRNLEFCGDRWYLGTQLLGRFTYPDVPTVGVFDSEFTLVDTLGGYDPLFQGRRAILQESTVSLDCEEGLIITTQAKSPNIQVISMEKRERIGTTDYMPPSFMLSEKFISMSNDAREWTRYMSEEQSLTLRLAHSDRYIFHVFRNDRNLHSMPRRFNDSDHFVAVYDKESLDYLGEAKLPGAVLGSTKDGYLIVLSDEEALEIQFIAIQPDAG